MENEGINCGKTWHEIQSRKAGRKKGIQWKNTKAAVLLMMMNSALDQIRSDDSTEFAEAVPGYIQTMIELTEEETKINVCDMRHGREAAE